MQHQSDVLKQTKNTDSLTENQLKKGTEQMVSVIPGINRFIEDIRVGHSSGSRIDVQIDWAQGRMAISY